MKKIVLLLILQLTTLMASFLISVEEGSEKGTLTLETAQQTDASSEINYKDAPFLSVIPGLYSFGTETRGAYGGSVEPKILHVDTLSGDPDVHTDDTHGSFGWCLKQKFPRIIVFDVSGEIHDTRPEPSPQSRKLDYDISSPYCYVAGQTAPSPGISIRNVGIRIYTHDIVFQHLRFRKGDEAWESSSGINIRGNNDHNIIIDHCSFAWGVDKHFASWNDKGQGIHDYTISNCLFGEHLDYSINPKGHHPTNVLFGYDNKNIAFINNLQISNGWRNPWFHGGCEGVVYNNLTYNPTFKNMQLENNAKYNNWTPIKLNYEGNVMVKGPDTSSSMKLISGASSLNSSSTGGADVFLKDNISQGTNVPTESWDTSVRDDSNNRVRRATTRPVDTEGKFSAFPAVETEKYVLANAGARPALRSEDVTDTRIVNTFINRTGETIDCVGPDTFPYSYPYSPGSHSAVYQTCKDYNNCCTKNAGGWPKIIGQTKKFIPTSNPHALHSNGSGYTNLEVQLHALTKFVEKGQ